MPKLSLRKLITLGVALGILVPALVLSRYVLKDRYERELALRVREPMSQYTQMLASAMATPIWNVDKPVADQLIEAVMRNPDVVHVTVEDELGNVFASAAIDQRRKGTVLSEQRDIMFNGKQIGRVTMELSADRIERQLWSDLMQLCAALLAQVAISFALVLLLVERRVIRPLYVLQMATARLARGELNEALRWHRSDEIGGLAQGLDQMRESLGSLIAERDIKNADLQQELNERLRAEQALRATEAKFKAIFHASPLAMTVSRQEPGNPIVDINDAGLRQFRLTRQALLNSSHALLWRHRQDQETVLDVIAAKGHIKGYEAWLCRGAGNTLDVQRDDPCDEGADAILCEVSGRMIDLDDEQLVILVLEDITERKRAAEIIWNQANFDRLTGLPNRHMFQDRLEQEMIAAQRTGLSLALVFFDLDLFKEVNDTLGHEMGDVLLQQTAQRLRAGVGANDTVARLGGDEFTLILAGLDGIGNAHKVVHNVLLLLSQPFSLGDQLVHISTSAGITFYPQDAAAVEALLKNADQAMYAAKSEGRNRYNVFAPAMQEEAQKRMRLINDLRVAIAEDQLSVYYQPIVDLATGAIHKAEALLRWRHPTEGMISPADFIPVAEETGLIVSIGDWVFQQAAQQAAIWRKSFDPQFQISVNVSPRQFRNEGIDHGAWLEHMERLGLPGQAIVVEITEGLLMDAEHGIIDQLMVFRDAGIRVSLDDFGTGYSSLSYLKKFHIDYLKIDQSFVRNLEANSDDMALCDAIIVMAHKLGLKVIAEGVETEDQRDLLRDAGCDFGQGYLFARPSLPEQFAVAQVTFGRQDASV